MASEFPLVFGLDTFGDVTHDDDRPLSHAQTIRDLVEQGVLADEAGIDTQVIPRVRELLATAEGAAA
jgi:hypothetical protein